ncbi:MAG: hypothetical protein LBO02_01075, partial [Holosporaceae bacterium]|nr:hypothetical protein [Holosporaceae bacterium]
RFQAVQIGVDKNCDNNATRGGGRTLKKTRIGVILVEFAFAMPVLIALLYYMHDLPRLKQINSRMSFCAYCMASMLQEVSQNRENKKITVADLKNVATSAFLTIYPGKTTYPTSLQKFIYGHFLDCFVHCVKGVNGNASVLWNKRMCSYNYTGAGPSDIYCGSFTGSHWSSMVKCQQNVAPSSICKDLTIKNGETKIIVECLSYVDLNYGFTDGRPGSTSARERFGFWIMNIKPRGGTCGYFNQVVIFTPKPGLFDETQPT